jgi:hypothetical protein
MPPTGEAAVSADFVNLRDELERQYTVRNLHIKVTKGPSLPSEHS